MERMINNELVAYKSGFGDGRFDVLRQITNNSGIDKDMFVKMKFEYESWYSYGYDDSYNYYLNLYLENGYINEEFVNVKHANKVMEESYANRVIEFNQKNNSEVPIGKFRM